MRRKVNIFVLHLFPLNMYPFLFEVGLICFCLDHEIEEIEWSPDGSLIVVGVSAGILYVIDAESTEIVFSIVSCSNCPKFLYTNFSDKWYKQIRQTQNRLILYCLLFAISPK